MNAAQPGAAVAAVPAVPEIPFPKALPENAMLGIWLAVASTVLFSAGDMAAKVLTDTMPAGQVAWMRYAVFVMLVVPAVLALRGRSGMSTSQPWWQAARGIGVVASSLLFVMGLGHLDVSEATAINFVSPIFMMALSIPMLGEQVGFRRWSAAAVSFAGVLVVVQPGTDAFTAAALFPMGAALCWAFASIVTRMMSAERPEVTLAWSAVIGLAALSFALPFGWTNPSWREVAIAVLMGVLSTAGNWLAILAFRLAPAAVLAPFFYLQLVSAALFSYLLFGIVPGQATFAGGAIIAASGLYVAHRERVRRREALEAART